MKKFNAFKKSDQALTSRYFFIIFLLIGSILAGTISVLYNLESKDYLSQLKLEEQNTLKLQKQIILNNLEAIISDLYFLSRQNELSALFDNNSNAIKKKHCKRVS